MLTCYGSLVSTVSLRGWNGIIIFTTVILLGVGLHASGIHLWCWFTESYFIDHPTSALLDHSIALLLHGPLLEKVM